MYKRQGKTFTIANAVARLNRPTLVISHNKILAAQLASEFRSFFPENSVEYFVSYYDYYQPEAYVPQTDTYIEKDALVNDEIDKLRHSATCALFERRDVLTVASVSCIYGLGSPEDYKDLVLSIRKGMIKDRDDILLRLVAVSYTHLYNLAVNISCSTACSLYQGSLRSQKSFFVGIQYAYHREDVYKRQVVGSSRM